MPDPKKYSSVYTTMDNALLAEAASISIRKNPAINPVLTLALGWAGFGIGAAFCDMTIECEVPAADFEVNPDKFMVVGKLVEIGAVMANRQMTGKMVITGADYGGSVNQSAKVTINLQGPLAPWE